MGADDISGVLLWLAEKIAVPLLLLALGWYLHHRRLKHKEQFWADKRELEKVVTKKGREMMASHLPELRPYTLKKIGRHDKHLLEEVKAFLQQPNLPERLRPESQEILYRVNQLLTDVIDDYLQLFFRNYHKIKVLGQEMSTSLENTYKSFQELSGYVRQIKSSKYRDLQTEISRKRHTKSD
ncbi:MAG: hypothetical protein D6730_14365 [Bacteroidetes bacterium]|nr:MAG: hypothetical protein D6730_14365 [Bacteroidota bacterium]